MCVFARVRARACQPACVSVRACVCVYAHMLCVFAMAKINKVGKTTEFILFLFYF